MIPQTYTQCLLIRGNMSHRAFIPSRFAVLGDVLRIREEAGWSDGWLVIEVGQTLERDAVLAVERAYEKSGVRSAG